MNDKQFQLADDFLRRFASALRSAQLYSAGHPIIARNIDALVAGVGHVHASQPTITIGIVGTEIVVGDVPIGKVELLGELVKRMQLRGLQVTVTGPTGVAAKTSAVGRLRAFAARGNRVA